MSPPTSSLSPWLPRAKWPPVVVAVKLHCCVTMPLMHCQLLIGAPFARARRHQRQNSPVCIKIDALAVVESRQDSGLINGKGQYVNGPLVPHAVVNVERGKHCTAFGIEHDPVEVQNFDIWPALADKDMHPIAQEGPKGLGSGLAGKSIVLTIDNLINPPFFGTNNISYISPSIPVLLQLLSGEKWPKDLLPSEQVFIIERNKIIDVTFPVATGHPFHLHGHTFDVMRTSGEEAFNFKKRMVPPLPHRLDLEAGLAIVFTEAPEDNVSGPAAQITPGDWKDLCPEYNEIDPEFQ
ncbi:multicopper oxidase [Macrolepiota fuliginosa MF-IS2]|uniref:Multicopper oxidase n=1 Tax=Macrolepiota fuliginosa MF-IS2 TaxID=1400762 RepID=A0A9P6C107_9AGAR|nr:multicopper oxidase [Macrolepiota fuliginosa MF-IS2]